MSVPTIWWRDHIAAEAGEGAVLAEGQCAGVLVLTALQIDAPSLVRAVPTPPGKYFAGWAVGATQKLLKAGRVYHTLQEWRSSGVFERIVLEAPDAAVAAWMIEHTPAWGVAVPFDRLAPQAGLGLAVKAGEIGTVLIADVPDAEVAAVALGLGFAAVVTKAKDTAAIRAAVARPVDRAAAESRLDDMLREIGLDPLTARAENKKAGRGHAAGDGGGGGGGGGGESNL